MFYWCGLCIYDKDERGSILIFMEEVTLISGDRTGVEIAEVPRQETVYCNLSYGRNIIEVEVGIRIWAENLIDDPNPHKNEDCEFWESWISLDNYYTLLDLLADTSFDSYDDVNDTRIAYTPCTSTGAICFVCDNDLGYRKDSVSITASRGPIYCHQDCFSEFQESVRSLESKAPELLSQII